jgi:hypothetical protein
MAETWPGQLPVHAIEAGNEAFVVEAAESFAAAEPAEREIALAFLCDVGAVRRLTHEDPERTAMVLEIAQLLGAGGEGRERQRGPAGDARLLR